MKNVVFILVLAIFCLSAWAGVVVNKDKPSQGIWDLKMKKVWEITEAGGDVFADITRLDLTDKDHLIVKDRRRFKLYIIDEKGKFIKSFGKRREGPGEIKRMNGAGFYLADNLIVIPDQGRIHFFTEAGEFIKTVPINPSIQPRAFIDKNTLISAPAASFDRNSGKEKIRIYHLDNKETKVLAEYNPFKEATQAQESEGNRMVIAIVIGGLTPMMEIQYHNGVVYYGMNDRYAINMVDVKGQAKGGFKVEGRKPKPVSMEFKKGIFNRAGSNAPPAMIDRMVKGLPDVATYFNRIEIDDHGLIYLGIPDPEQRYKQQIDIFSPQGKFLYTTTIALGKDKRIRNLAFKHNLIFLAVEDEEGDVSVAKYNVSLPTI